jgi:hypothetical protein
VVEVAAVAAVAVRFLVFGSDDEFLFFYIKQASLNTIAKLARLTSSYCHRLLKYN